jgi:hypothetical protein
MRGLTRIMLAVGLVSAQLVALRPAAACSTVFGSVHDSNTIDIVNFSGNFSAGSYVLGVKAEGDGDNTLTIKVEVPGSLGGWTAIATGEIDLGNTNGCGYREVQFTLSSSSAVRYRFSRKIGTKQIDFRWDHDFIVLWGGQSFRCLTC